MLGDEPTEGIAVTASVVIPAHDAAHTIGDQLSALARQVDAPPFEVIVVANQCSDATAEVARSFSDRLRIRVIEADDRASASHARNVGAAASNGRFLLFCDADDVAGDTWVAGMLGPLMSGAADFVGGIVEVHPDDLPHWLYRWRYEQSPRRSFLGVVGELPYVGSGSFGVTAEAFHSIEGFDTSLAHGEDVDVCWRLLRAGHRIGEAPDAVERYRPRTTLAASLAQRRAYARSALHLRAREGTLGPAPTRRHMVAHTLKSIAHCVVVRREVHPLYIYADAWHRWSCMLDHRRAPELVAASALTPTRHEVAVHPGTPLVGGLAFETTQRATTQWYADGAAGGAFRSLGELVSAGDLVVDVGAGVGIFTIAAARAVGPTGSVVALEASPDAAAALGRNVERHGVGKIVSSDGVTSIDEASPDTRPALVRIDARRLVTDELRTTARTAVRHADAVLLVVGTSWPDWNASFPADDWNLWLLDDRTTGPRRQQLDPDARRTTADESMLVLATRRHRAG